MLTPYNKARNVSSAVISRYPGIPHFWTRPFDKENTLLDPVPMPPAATIGL